MSGFMILCGKCGSTIKLTPGTKTEMLPIVLFGVGIACECGNAIAIGEEHVVQDETWENN